MVHGFQTPEKPDILVFCMSLLRSSYIFTAEFTADVLSTFEVRPHRNRENDSSKQEAKPQLFEQ